MILAAGRGVRMGSLTADRPKPLVTVAGRTLIDRQLRYLAAAGVADVVINLSYRGAQIRDAVGAGERYGLNVVYSQEPDEPLETAGGIVAALPLLGDAPFLVVNADVVCDFEIARLDWSRGAGQLVVVPNPPHNPNGDYGVDADSRLTQRPPKLTYAGIAWFDPRLFAGLEPGRRPLVPVLDDAIAAGALYGVRHDGVWFDIGTPERLAVAEAALAG